MVPNRGLDKRRTARIRHGKCFINIEIGDNPSPAPVNFPLISSQEMKEFF